MRVQNIEIDDNDVVLFIRIKTNRKGKFQLTLSTPLDIPTLISAKRWKSSLKVIMIKYFDSKDLVKQEDNAH